MLRIDKRQEKKQRGQLGSYSRNQMSNVGDLDHSSILKVVRSGQNLSKFILSEEPTEFDDSDWIGCG